MAAQLADASLVDPCAVYEATERPATGCDRVVANGNRWMTVARRVTGDVLIALPFWALIAFMVYLVL